MFRKEFPFSLGEWNRLIIKLNLSSLRHTLNMSKWLYCVKPYMIWTNTRTAPLWKIWFGSNECSNCSLCKTRLILIDGVN